jgi:hypothetical protein
MALSNDYNNGMIMPVAPMYGGGYGGNAGGLGFGGDWAWILLLLVLGGGWGGFGFGGMGGMMGAGMMGGLCGMDMLYPWLNNSEHISDGFRDQQLSAQVGSIGSAITSGFGDVQTALCGGFAGVNQNISQGFANANLGMCQGFNGVNTAISGAQNALAQQMYTNQIADLERSYAAQTANTAGLTNVSAQLANCCCENRAATADLKYTVATEECATRNASAMNTRDTIEAITRGNQAILDKLCALELDGVKGQLEQAQRENVALQNAVNMATMQASQTAQTAQILAGQAAEIDGVYNRLKNCPVPSMPVYGNTPIFTCPGNSGGCGCGAF